VSLSHGVVVLRAVCDDSSARASEWSG
jgi:hypothetical protein